MMELREWDKTIAQGEVIVLLMGDQYDKDAHVCLRARSHIHMPALIEKFKLTTRFSVLQTFNTGTHFSNQGWEERFISWAVDEEFFEDLKASMVGLWEAEVAIVCII